MRSKGNSQACTQKSTGMAGWLHVPGWSHQPTLNPFRSGLCHRGGRDGAGTQQRDGAGTQQPTPENPPTSPPSSARGGICVCSVSWGLFFFFFLSLQVWRAVNTEQPQHPVAQGSPVQPCTLCRSASSCLL